MSNANLSDNISIFWYIVQFRTLSLEMLLYVVELIHVALISRNEDHEENREMENDKIKRLLQRPPPEIPV